MWKAALLAGALIGSFVLLADTGHANPPPGVRIDPAVHEWFAEMKDHRGISCCSEADCRHTMIRSTESGGMEGWIGREQFGPGAPDAWLPVPVEEIKMRGNRPPGIVGAIVCYYAGAIHCLDEDAGT